MGSVIPSKQASEAGMLIQPVWNDVTARTGVFDPTMATTAMRIEEQYWAKWPARL